MPDTIDFLLLSDLHVSHRAPSEAGLLTDTSATLEEAVAMIATMDIKPEFIVFAGDLTNHGEVDAYHHLSRLLAPLEVPKIFALGNHDSRPAFRSVILEGAGSPEEPHLHEEVIAGIHVIVLDSSIPGRIAGALGEGQISFLRGALSRNPDLPKVVVCHHPPHLDGTEANWHSLDPASTAMLAEALADAKVLAILAGHVHFDSVIHWHGVPVIIGTGFHNAVDVTFRSGLRVVDGAGFTLCRVRPSGLTATFVPLARSRRQLVIHDLARLNAIDRQAASH